MGKRTSVYLSDELSAAVKASGKTLAEIIRRGLEADSGARQPAPEIRPAGPQAPPVTVIPARREDPRGNPFASPLG